MNEILIYLGKVSLAVTLVSIPYFLMLRNDPLLVVKRTYLLAGLALAWVFPLLVLNKTGIVSGFQPTFIIDPGTVSQAPNLPESSAGPGISLVAVTGILYVSGMLLLFTRTTMAYLKTVFHQNNKPTHIKDVVSTSGQQIFTIFPKIFIPEKLLEDADLFPILIHERAHIRQLHIIDLLVAELTLVLTWFNPFSWLISRMIKENHEHLADRMVLQQGVKPAHYKALLLNHAMGGQIFQPGHQFNHSLTKKRFQMMKKLKAPKRGFLKYILIVPVILTCTLVATASAQQAKTIRGTIYLESIKEPAHGASVIIAGTSSGTVADSKGEFTLKVEGNPEIVISFVGYETVWVNARDIQKKPVIMIPKPFEINPDEYSVRAMPDKHVKVRVVEGEKSKEIFVTSTDGAFKVKDEEDMVYVVDGKVVSSIENIDPEEIEEIKVIKRDKPETSKIIIQTKGNSASTNKSGDNIIMVKKLEGTGSGEETFIIVEDVPSFPGGTTALGAYIHENLVYPPEAVKQQMAGKVMVEFTVMADGSLKNIRVSQSTNDLFNDAALKIFENMPAWKPGLQRNKPVSCNVIVPVRFNPAQE